MTRVGGLRGCSLPPMPEAGIAGVAMAQGSGLPLPQLLVASGATLAAAVAIGALVGPAQVAGRLLEFGVLPPRREAGSLRPGTHRAFS